jgi:hypothetical protein
MAKTISHAARKSAPTLKVSGTTKVDIPQMVRAHGHDYTRTIHPKAYKQHFSK